MIRPVYHSSKSDEWATPTDVYAYLDERFGPFDLDAAASTDNAKCSTFYTMSDDALCRSWRGRVWCNPPYSKLKAFVEKAICEVREGRAEVVVLLVPARPQTIWWREAFEYADEVLGISGALRFGNATANAPFGSTVFVIRRHRNGTWTATKGLRYSMPTRHTSRPRWFELKAREERTS